MVDDKERYDEEGEYHFSDDQANYEVEPEVYKAAPAASPFNKEALLAKFSQHRRKIVGAVSLTVLVMVVYKILVPVSTVPATEFNQTKVAAKIEKPAESKVKNLAVSQPSATTAQPSTVAQAPTPMMTNKAAPNGAQQNPTAVTTASTSSAFQPAVATTQQQSPSPVAMSGTPSGSQTNANTPSAIAVPPAPQPMTAQVNTVQPPVIDAQIKEKIVALEQQNSAMMNLLQTEYAQKIADNETQSSAARGKMEELTKRINRMEISLNQITQLLQGVAKPQASNTIGGVPIDSSRSEPRVLYSVQAIIPGRAWLKSESGDIVTVAETDYLKGYGRVTKIDPYDGIVSIDTGKKVINLSYGAGGD